jgi:hypothetical protein
MHQQHHPGATKPEARPADTAVALIVVAHLRSEEKKYSCVSEQSLRIGQNKAWIEIRKMIAGSPQSAPWSAHYAVGNRTESDHVLGKGGGGGVLLVWSGVVIVGGGW